MRDPHVVSLAYRIECDEETSFENPPPVECERPEFTMCLEGGIARFEMTEHYATEDEAKEPVELFLRAWEMIAALKYGRHEISFKFDVAEVIDLDPPPPGSPQIVHVSGIASVSVVGTATIHVIHRTYPQPPVQFTVSPDVETLWSRYNGYLQGREPLAAMAYACLSFLEAVAGGRRGVAKQYCISMPILDNIGRLATEIGDLLTARKFRPGGHPREITSSERTWMEAAIKATIRRVGEYAHDPNAIRSKLTMDDLPKLKSG